ncbi:ribosyldihydronicotinamide dehydrogenase [quinone] [Octopus bimaculoides]|uniref:Flavodoxin-like fold domain-containing protein n=1 Tax=Octopus bimaculoides TaxID=37653 RepID=A0A0L8GAV3_OCTBM|nr:ribosyldihydronicotinamide dehydrogenase [quinone] [Octopus bimaculoides]XP_014782678.1 ribosyldihydronicotinamide dehydrogenase [quinone] [Octopus bimaculoides]XP_014782679.1 ribosyldihydronicotinamide dehydrogenase [quinone] [Octopus bimaculoides]|eukprot:XP_014782676.1 PREDICTED: ribosyldihydronicotinamide dehydrogenase [quinone]-like [Octopus bimaculoides]
MLKRVLIVFAHEEPKSLNATLKNYAVKVFKDKGYEIKESDLYAQKFDPVIRRKDVIDSSSNKDHIQYSHASANAYAAKTLPPYIQEELNKVSWADFIYFQFPLYWYAMPAILKGWFEKVLISGFAYDQRQGKLLDNGLLKGKRTMLSFTTGSSEPMFAPNGFNGDINVALWPTQYSLYFCGLDVLKPFMVNGAHSMNEEKLAGIKKALQEKLSKIQEEKPMEFISMMEFSFPPGQLSESYMKKMSAVDTAPTIGHHLGKKFPCLK